jgi:hypothetical protein
MGKIQINWVFFTFWVTYFSILFSILYACV